MAIHPTISHLLSLPQPAQRSSEWYAARHERLTASDAATALGLNPYETYDQLVLKKCGHGPKFMGNEATRHGQKWEDYVSDLFCKQYGYQAYDAGLLLHPTIPFLGGSPDGLLSTEDGSKCALLEIKCPLYREIKDEVPAYYVPQIQLCMEICDVDSCWFVQFKPETLIASQVFSAVEVSRDRKWFADALPVFQAFWTEVEACRANGVEAVLARIESRKRPRASRTLPTRIAVLDDEEACMIVPQPKRPRQREDEQEEGCMITPQPKLPRQREDEQEGGCMIAPQPTRPRQREDEQEDGCMITPQTTRPRQRDDEREDGCMITPQPTLSRQHRGEQEGGCVITPQPKRSWQHQGELEGGCMIAPQPKRPWQCSGEQQKLPWQHKQDEGCLIVLTRPKQ